MKGPKKTFVEKKVLHFSFWNTIFCVPLIYNSAKRNFVQLISQVINRKLSVENLLKISNNIEALKEFILDEGKMKQFNELPAPKLEKLLEQFEILEITKK